MLFEDALDQDLQSRVPEINLSEVVSPADPAILIVLVAQDHLAGACSTEKVHAVERNVVPGEVIDQQDFRYFDVKNSRLFTDFTVETILPALIRIEPSPGKLPHPFRATQQQHLTEWIDNDRLLDDFDASVFGHSLEDTWLGVAGQAHIQSRVAAVALCHRFNVDLSGALIQIACV